MKKGILYLSFLIFFLFSFLMVQFFKVQILDGDHWINEGKKQHYFAVKEPFKRGKFIANTEIKKGHPEELQYFVYDVPKFHLYIDPLSIPVEYHDVVSDGLQSLIDVTVNESTKFRQQFSKKSRSRKLAMWLERKERERILDWWRPFAKKRKIPSNAVYFVNDFKRSYPFGKLLGQVLHTIQDQRDEETHQALPTGGLELSLNEYLKGKQGKRLLMRSPRNALEMGNVIEEPQDGADVYLTINHVLQAIVEEELEKGVRKARAKVGWAVMMNPHNGEILALAQYPFFRPSDYSYYYSDCELIPHTKVKAVSDANEPGSIMKAITLAVALEANRVLKEKGEKLLFTPEEKILCANGDFPGRKQPIKDTRVHREMNMDLGLQRSSNIYVARLMQRVVNQLGDQWYHDVLQEQFGFGKKTGIELPGESRGLLPTPGRVHRGFLEWSKATPYSLSMGYNLQANSIQLLRAYSVLANGGYLVQPKLVKKIRKEGEIVVDKSSDEKKRVLDRDITERVKGSMKFTSLPGGTARFGKIPGFTQGTKTGTARKIVKGAYSTQKHVASYMGFTPLKDPEIVLIVSLDEPEVVFIPGMGNNCHGSICAAPIFKEIAKRSLEYLGTTPDDPFGFPVGDPRHDPQKTFGMKENQELQEMYEKWNN